MARRDANGLLAALIAEADWTAGELARAVNGLGMAQGLCLRYDRTSVAHWLTGSRPRPRSLILSPPPSLSDWAALSCRRKPGWPRTRIPRICCSLLDRETVEPCFV